MQLRWIVAVTALITGTGAPLSVSAQEKQVDSLTTARARCSAYGYRSGTDTFAQCVQGLAQRFDRDEGDHAAREALRKQCRLLKPNNVNPSSTEVAMAQRCADAGYWPPNRNSR